MIAQMFAVIMVKEVPKMPNGCCMNSMKDMICGFFFTCL